MNIRRPALLGPASLSAALLVPFGALTASLPASPARPPAGVQAHFLAPEPGPLVLRPDRPVVSRARRPAEPVFVAPDGARITVARVRRYLEGQGSPMAPYARTLVVAGIRERVDPRVVVAIAGAESSFGVYRRGYNAWGWDVAHVRFRSWDDAIIRYTAAIAARYPGMRYGDFASGAAAYDPPDPSSWTMRCTGYFRGM